MILTKSFDIVLYFWLSVILLHLFKFITAPDWLLIGPSILLWIIALRMLIYIFKKCKWMKSNG